jgi:hypothetical protein
VRAVNRIRQTTRAPDCSRAAAPLLFLFLISYYVK